MQFPTASSIPRPIRLSESIREWAWESLHGKYGDDAVKNSCIMLDSIPDFENLSDTAKYDAAIKHIALESPIRICSEEKICGSATLGDAIKHVIPARYNGENIFSSVSHLTIQYDKVLKFGLNSYIDDINARQITYIRRYRISVQSAECDRQYQNMARKIS